MNHTVTYVYFKAVLHKSVRHNHICCNLRVSTRCGLHRPSSGCHYKTFKMRQNKVRLYSQFPYVLHKLLQCTDYILNYKKNYIKFFYIHKFDIIFNNFLVILEVLILPIYNLKTCTSQPPAKTHHRLDGVYIVLYVVLYNHVCVVITIVRRTGSRIVNFNCILTYFEGFVMVAWWWSVQTETYSRAYIKINVVVFDGFMTYSFEVLYEWWIVWTVS